MNHTRTALLLAAVPATLAAAGVALRVGHWSLYVDRYQIELSPQARSNCARCYGDGGWWIGGALPEMEACGCWADRRGIRIRLLPRSPIDSEPPF